MQDLGTLPGTTLSFAAAINDFGQVVGDAETPYDCCYAHLRTFRWTPFGGMRDLGTLGGAERRCGWVSTISAR
jgi:probable HAF family extracellular repeat protein